MYFASGILDVTATSVVRVTGLAASILYLTLSAPFSLPNASESEPWAMSWKYWSCVELTQNTLSSRGTLDSRSVGKRSGVSISSFGKHNCPHFMSTAFSIVSLGSARATSRTERKLVQQPLVQHTLVKLHLVSMLHLHKGTRVKR